MTSQIAIFASGNGTNFAALLAAIQEQHLPVQVALLVCDQADAPVIQKAQAAKVPVIVINYSHFPNKAAAEHYLLDQLLAAKVTWIFLAGFMRIVGPTLLNFYSQQIINIHPALLPKFPGRHGIEDAYAAQVPTTGVTIHFVDAGVDTGKIIAQQTVPRYPTDTLEQLAQRIHQTEHQLYPTVLRKLLSKEPIK